MANRVSKFKTLKPLSIQKDTNIPLEGRDVVYARQLLSVIGLDPKEGSTPINSVYINPKDKQALQNAIELLFSESKEERKLRIEKGFAYVQRFNDNVIAENWNSCYKSVLKL